MYDAKRYINIAQRCPRQWHESDAGQRIVYTVLVLAFRSSYAAHRTFDQQ